MDDHPVFRYGLAAVINADERFQVVAEAGNGKEALDILERFLPELVVIDVEMPIKDGIEAAREIRLTHPQLPLIFLTLHEDRQILQEMKRLRVDGYILKDSARDEILLSLEVLHAGGTYISPRIHQSLNMGAWDKAELGIRNDLQKLTSSELSVIDLVASSMSNKEIAVSLFISVRTVENHRSNICTKLNLVGTNALLKYAIAHRRMIGKYISTRLDK